MRTETAHKTLNTHHAIRARVMARLARAGRRELEELARQPSHQCSVLQRSEPQKQVVTEL